jgi:hypothetical protein
MSEELPPDDVLPCGCIARCRIVEGRKEFQLIPCKLSCKNLQIALEMAKEEGKPVETRFIQ